MRPDPPLPAAGRDLSPIAGRATDDRDLPSTRFLRVRTGLRIPRERAACPRVSTHNYRPSNQPRPLQQERPFSFMEKIAMRGPCTFRKRDVTRAIQAVMAAGVEGRVEIESNGKIAIVIGKRTTQDFVVPNASNDNTWSDVDAA